MRIQAQEVQKRAARMTMNPLLHQMKRTIKLELYGSSRPIGEHERTVTPPRTQPVLIWDVIKSDLIKSVSKMETKSNTAFRCFCFFNCSCKYLFDCLIQYPL